MLADYRRDEARAKPFAKKMQAAAAVWERSFTWPESARETGSAGAERPENRAFGY